MKYDRDVSILSTLLNRIESAYGMYADAALDIAELVERWNQQFADMEKDELQELQAEALDAIILLSFTTDRLEFFGKKRLDFSKYPAMPKVVNILLQFVSADSINEESVRSVNMIVELLVEIDRRFMNFKGGLGYRFLRVFVMLVLAGNYLGASIVARFILTQLVGR